MLMSKFIDDILLRVKEISDDAYLPKEQVAHWLSLYRDALVKEYLDELISKGKALDTFYIEREACLELQEESEECIDDTDERRYVQISKQPMSLLDDKGFVKLTTNEGVMVNRSRLESIEWVNDLPYSKPSCRNLVYYRDNKKIVIQGTKNTSVDFIAYYIPSYASQELSDTDEFKIHDSLVPQLMTLVEDVARREIYQRDDTDNQGEDDKQVAGE